MADHPTERRDFEDGVMEDLVPAHAEAEIGLEVGDHLDGFFGVDIRHFEERNHVPLADVGEIGDVHVKVGAVFHGNQRHRSDSSYQPWPRTAVTSGDRGSS